MYDDATTRIVLWRQTVKYRVTKLDGRFSYRSWFEYYIGFTGQMSNSQGPVHFNDALKWFFQTYGWSAEIQQYDRILRWNQNQYVANLVGGQSQGTEHCNPHWSWTNHYTELRIYVASEKELAFFQLSHPLDQK